MPVRVHPQIPSEASAPRSVEVPTNTLGARVCACFIKCFDCFSRKTPHAAITLAHSHVGAASAKSKDGGVVGLASIRVPGSD